MCANYSASPPLARQRKHRKLIMTEFTKTYDVDYDGLFMLLPMKVIKELIIIVMKMITIMVMKTMKMMMMMMMMMMMRRRRRRKRRRSKNTVITFEPRQVLSYIQTESSYRGSPDYKHQLLGNFLLLSTSNTPHCAGQP